MLFRSLAPKENWICDRITSEWYKHNQDISTINPYEADVIWLQAGWCWNHLTKELLENKYWVTLDFGIEFIETVTDTGLMKFERFIPMVSAKIPNIYKLNKNTTLKIDDVTWGHSNTGVWSKNLKAITENMHYTDWSEYVGDTVINVDNEE